MKLCLTVVFVLSAAAASAHDDPPAPLPGLAIGDAVVWEGSPGDRNKAQFVVTLTNAPQGLVTVRYATRDLTAHAGSDYTGSEGLLRFDGTVTAVIGVEIVGDLDATEGSEAFFVQLSSPTGAVIADALGHGVIRDDDVTAHRRPRCDLDGDGSSNLMAYYEPHHELLPPDRHNPQHEDWGCSVTLCEPGALVEYTQGAPTDWVLLAMADFDDNRTCDLFWERDGEVRFTYTAPGAPLKAPDPDSGDGPTYSSPGPGWRLVGSGNFDADPRADLLWWKASPPHALRVWLTTAPHGQVEREIPVAGADTLDPLAVVDLNGDGSVGIVWRDAAGGLVHWALQDLVVHEVSPLAAGTGDVVGPGWTLAAVGDFNGDGPEDLVWQGPRGRVAVWFMRGTTRLAESPLSPELLMLEDQQGVVRGPR
jgi:hypothetical protein